MRNSIFWSGSIAALIALHQPVDARTPDDDSAQDAAQGKVRVNCDLENFKKAVNGAKEGETVIVRGTCTGGVVVRKDGIKIVGRDGASIVVPDDGVGITVIARGARIKGVNIVGGRVGIDVFGGASAEILKNQIVDYTEAGIEVRANSNAAIAGNFLTTSSTALAAINLVAGASAQVDNNEITDPGGYGINVAATSSVFMGCNTVTLSHPFFAGVSVSRTAQVGFSPDCANTISNNHMAGTSISCSQTSSIFAGTDQVLTGALGLDPNCEVVRLAGVTVP